MHTEQKDIGLSKREIERNHAGMFVFRYIQAIRQPLILQNHAGAITYTSDERSLVNRGQALLQYLIDQDPETEKYYWGRTILAEIVAKQVLEEALSPYFASHHLTTVLTPTSIDRSSYYNDPVYQKGADICIIQSVPGSCPVPVCGIDFTVGNTDTIKDKRTHAGIQCQAAMPVIVLPLVDFTFGSPKTHNFKTYLDEQSRQTILQGLEIRPFYGLTDGEIRKWKFHLGVVLQAAVAACRTGLQDCRDPRVIQYPHLGYVLGQLDFMDELIADYYQQQTTGIN